MTKLPSPHKQGHLTLLAFLLLLIAGQGTALAHDPQGRPTGHIVLGDSIECGVVFDIGAPQFGVGYVDPFHAYVESDVLMQALDLVNLCELGATSRDMVTDQLFEAAFEIRDRDFVVVTMGGGGNDLRRFITSSQAVTCIQGDRVCLERLNALLNEIEQNLRLILQTLRAAAGEEDQGSALLIRTQYNALKGRSALDAPCAGPELILLADLALEGDSPLLEEGLNDRIRRVAGEHGARVADIFTAFDDNPGELISGDCTHPTDAGYVVIYQAFRNVF